MFDFKIGTVFCINGNRYQIVGYQKNSRFSKSGRAVIQDINSGKRFSYGWEALKHCDIRPADDTEK